MISTLMLAALSVAAWTTPPAQAGPDAEAVVDAIANEYAEGRRRHTPELAALFGLGIDRYDAIERNDAASIAAWHEREDDWIDRLADLDPAALDGPRRLTFSNLLESLESSRGLRVCRQELWRVNFMGGWHQVQAQVMENVPVETAEQRSQLLQRAERLPQMIDIEIGNLRRGLELGYSTPRSVVQRVVAQIDGMIDAPDVNAPFLSPARRSSDPDFAKAFSERVEKSVHPAFRRYRNMLEEEYVPRARTDRRLGTLPGGLECYDAKLRSYLTLDIGAEELATRGRALVQAKRDRIENLGRTLYGTTDIAEIRRRIVQNASFPTDVDLRTEAQAAISRSAALTEPWFPPFGDNGIAVELYGATASGMDSSYVGPQGSDGIGTLYLAPDDVGDRAALEHVVAHEGYPGHHLQTVLHRNTEKHPVNAIFFQSAFVEGWAMYAEFLAEEIGIYQHRATSFLRDASFAEGLVIDPSFHTLDWTEDETKSYIRTVSGKERSDEELEAILDRFAVLPGQYPAYDTGAMVIRDLRREAEAALGDRFDLRGFHGAVLENGLVTLELLGQQVRAWVRSTQARHADTSPSQGSRSTESRR